MVRLWACMHTSRTCLEQLEWLVRWLAQLCCKQPRWSFLFFSFDASFYRRLNAVEQLIKRLKLLVSTVQSPHWDKPNTTPHVGLPQPVLWVVNEGWYVSNRNTFFQLDDDKWLTFWADRWLSRRTRSAKKIAGEDRAPEVLFAGIVAFIREQSGVI